MGKRHAEYLLDTTVAQARSAYAGMTVRDMRNNGDEMMKMIMVGAGRCVRWWMIDVGVV